MINLAKGCNPSFIVLIPKKHDPIGFQHVCPISLIRCVDKVFSQLLALCLAKVINSIIGHNQSTFIEGRHILDGYIPRNEILEWPRWKSKAFTFKIDFEKDFIKLIGIFFSM